MLKSHSKVVHIKVIALLTISCIDLLLQFLFSPTLIHLIAYAKKFRIFAQQLSTCCYLSLSLFFVNCLALPSSMPRLAFCVNLAYHSCCYCSVFVLLASHNDISKRQPALACFSLSVGFTFSRNSARKLHKFQQKKC